MEITCAMMSLMSVAAVHAQTSTATAPAKRSGARKAGSANGGSTAATTSPIGYDYKNPPVQPATETIELDMYARIREEGLDHSHIMEYASALFDGIGPRLTGSPNLARADKWVVERLQAMGCANARLESWGEFGFGWLQIGTYVDIAAPDTAVLIAQATPWSPATNGAVTADVVAVPYPQDESAFDPWRGKLSGKIILLGKSPAVPPDPTPLLQHYDAAKLEQIVRFPFDGNVDEQHVDPDDPKFWANVFKQVNFREKIAKFFADEHAVALLLPSYAGDGGIMRDDNNEAMGQRVYMPDHKQSIPSVVLANEGFGRIARLLDANVPVSVTLNVDTKFTGEHELGYNALAEIPGTDPALKDQVAMFGGHLDSWIAGTGATDNGAGSIIALEAMRILNAVGAKPRRTIRIALWSGEEQGDMGSSGYVREHIAEMGLSTAPEQMEVPDFLRERVGPLTLKPDHALVSGYYNIDNGGGRLLGIYAEENAAIVPIFEQWIAPLHDLDVTTVTMRRTGGTDHESFDQVGVPGFQFIQDPRDYETRSVHTNQDVYERLSPADLKQAAVVEAIFVYNTAMRDHMLPRKPLPTDGTYEQKNAPLKDVMPGTRKP
ncbi:MAG: M20/M25/M40 family metallo-hydrolase [Candidatus Acidiferrales bacterium]